MNAAMTANAPVARVPQPVQAVPVPQQVPVAPVPVLRVQAHPVRALRVLPAAPVAETVRLRA